jgi:signal transduction histidine kinase
MLKRLEESKRKQIRFVDDASHELRTPIAVIQGYVNMLDRWGKDDPKVMEESITAIKDETVHMKTLIDQLLFLARGDMERHVIHKMPLDANELLEEVAEESRMIDASHEYLFETDGTSHPIHADPAMIKQVLRILTDNAAKYTPSGGTVKFRAYEKNARVCMEVSDTGIGISTDELPRIFDRFYRGQNLRGESSGGSGLGLSIAKWIVDEHSGEISAISSEGIGTRMTVSLDIYTG